MRGIDDNSFIPATNLSRIGLVVLQQPTQGQA
jgi:hypothetical protein